MERRYIESRLWTCLTSAFLEQVRSRYHFEEKDKALLKGVASDLAGCLKWKEAAYLMFEDGTDTVRRATAVVTLGSDVDLLQERYQNTGRMLESYMLESIGGELLMLGYGMLEAWIQENTGYQVAAYHFFGDDEAHPLSAMPEILARAKQHPFLFLLFTSLQENSGSNSYRKLPLSHSRSQDSHTTHLKYWLCVP